MTWNALVVTVMGHLPCVSVSCKPGITGVRQFKVKHCKSLICAMCVMRVSQGMATKLQRLLIAVQHQCVSQCSSKPAHESTVHCTIKTTSQLQCKSPYGRASVEIDCCGVQGIPLTTVQCAIAQETTTLSKVHPLKLPNKSKKTKTNQVGGVSSVGRELVTRYSGEPLVPRGAGDENCAGEENTAT